MMSKQILFRLEEDIATQLDQKLSAKGITKQFLFHKVVELFLADKLSLDSNMITNNPPPITIDSKEITEMLKKYYLNDLAKLIAEDNTLITLVTESLKGNVISTVGDIDNKMIADDTQEPLIVETETAELEDEPVTIEETETIDKVRETQNQQDQILRNNLDRLKSSSTSDLGLQDSNLVSNQEANSSQKADTTSEQSADNQTTHGGNKGNDTSREKTFDDSIATIKALKSEGKTNGEIVKVLNNHGYPTLKGSKGKWRSNQVQSILKKHQEK